MPWITTQIKGSDIDIVPFEDAVTMLRDMTEPLTLIGGRVRAGVAEAFITQGASGDQPWRELTPEYGRWKATHGPSLPLLVGLRRTGQKGHRPQTYSVSGHMRELMLSPAALHVTSRIMSYLPQSDIAGLHEEGTPRMVARPPLMIPERELLEWDKITDNWVAGILESVGL